MSVDLVCNALADLANNVTDLELAVMDGDLPAEVLARVHLAAERARAELDAALEIFP